MNVTVASLESWLFGPTTAALTSSVERSRLCEALRVRIAADNRAQIKIKSIAGMASQPLQPRWMSSHHLLNASNRTLSLP